MSIIYIGAEVPFQTIMPNSVSHQPYKSLLKYELIKNNESYVKFKTNINLVSWLSHVKCSKATCGQPMTVTGSTGTEMSNVTEGSVGPTIRGE